MACELGARPPVEASLECKSLRGNVGIRIMFTMFNPSAHNLMLISLPKYCSKT